MRLNFHISYTENVKILKFSIILCAVSNKMITFALAFEKEQLTTGKSPTVSSLGIPQDGNVARVLGCSGAIGIACPPASLAQLARARDL